MIFNTDDLYIENKSRNTLSLLESMGRIDRVFSKPLPSTIPLLENSNYGGAFVARYKDLLNLANEYEISIQESVDLVLKEHQLQPHQMIVSVEEWRPYVDPKIFYRFSNDYVISPEINTPAYRLCETCMEAFLESEDPIWLDIYFECPKNILIEGKNARAMKAKLGLNGGGFNLGKNPKELEKRLSELQTKRAQYEKIANDPKADESTKKGATQFIIQTDRTIDQLNAELQPVRDLQKQRALNRPSQQQSDAEILANMTPEQKAAHLRTTLRAKHGADLDAKNAPTIQTAQNTSDNSPSWLSQKWTALKNWWNNAGQNPNSGWFSRLVGKFKSAIGIGPKIITDPKVAADTAGKALDNAVKEMKPAEDAKETPKNDTTNTQPAQPAQPSTAPAPETKPEEKKEESKAGATPATNPTPPPATANSSNPDSSAK